MKLSVEWLREWVNPAVGLDELVAQLTMAGLEVDEVSPVAGDFEQVVVGEVMTTESHPDADKLSLCEVDVGAGHLLKIVCGASNVRPSLKVAVAMVGARLPGGLSIKKTKLRGELSEGMLCSWSELAMDYQAEGIIELANDAPVGSDLRDYLALDDHTLDIDLTPNRGDCLGVLGIAREVATLNRCALKSAEFPALDAVNDALLPVSIENYPYCGQYCGRVIKNIDNTVETPLWMVERLRRSGLRSLSPVVDISNYVMLELGQPMHAFDLAKIEGGIVVRMAKPSEPLTLLDGQELSLRDDSLVIADRSKALALAGIMGGLDSAVTEQSQDIFLESAFFSPQLIAGKARSYGLATDSSHRFERGVDPRLQALAIERASQLILDIVGGELGPLLTQKDEQYLPDVKLVELRVNRLRRVIGEDIDDEQLFDILSRLQMEVFAQGACWQVRVPTHRFDISIEADLIEEVARIYGYNNISDKPLQGRLMTPSIDKQDTGQMAFAKALVGLGYRESISYSFVDPRLQGLLYPEEQAMTLLNPISSELSQMRLGLWPGLLASAVYNQHRQCPSMKLFETGLTFVQEEGGLKQRAKVAGLLSGKFFEEHWSSVTREVDFFDMKGDVEALLASFDPQAQYRYEKVEHSALHPGQSAKILHGETVVGILGALHPEILAALDLTAPVMLFELDMQRLAKPERAKFKKISKYPSIRRDLSFTVDEGIAVSAIRDCVGSDEWLRSFDVFDVYQGESIEAGKKSIAISLTLQHPSRTLIDSEITSFMDAIIERLTQEFAITLRE